MIPGYNNPVLSGMNCDPSVCRVGDDFYLVSSSFTYFPGVPIYHSRDLLNWTLIGHCITRVAQADFSGMGCNSGLWADHAAPSRRPLLHGDHPHARGPALLRDRR